MVQPHHLKLETRNSKLSASLCLCISVVNCLFAQEPREYFIRQQTASRCEAQTIASRFQQTILYEVGDHCSDLYLCGELSLRAGTARILHSTADGLAM